MPDRYASLKQGLVGAWIPSVSGSGLVLPDLSGRGNNGTLTNMSAGAWVSGQYGRALDFDGSNDWVNAGNSSSLSFAPNNAFTLSSWIQLRNLPGNSLYGIIARGQYNNNLEYNFYIGENSNRVRFTLGDGVTNSVYFGRSSDPITSTSWAHYCARYDGSSILAGISIWINGQRIDNADYAGGGTYVSMANQSANVSIGALNFGNAFYMNGWMDDIRIYNRAITELEIKLLASEPGIGFKRRASSVFAKRYTYNPPKAKVFEGVRVRDHDYSSLRQGLVGAWCPSLPNGGSGNLLVDQSQRGNHGVLTNMSAGAWVGSGSGRALDFDGVNDRVEGTIEAGKEIRSISIWLNPASTINASSSGQAILNLKGPGASNIFWYVGVGSVTGLLSNEYITILDDNSYREGIADGGSISGWTHFAASWNGTRYSLYLNGILRTSITNNSYPPRIGTTTRSHFRIASLDDGTQPFAGQIDDVRVYERSLTEPEIKLLASRRGIGLQPSPTRFIAREKKTGLRRKILTGMP